MLHICDQRFDVTGNLENFCETKAAQKKKSPGHPSRAVCVPSSLHTAQDPSSSSRRTRLHLHLQGRGLGCHCQCIAGKEPASTCKAACNPRASEHVFPCWWNCYFGIGDGRKGRIVSCHVVSTSTSRKPGLVYFHLKSKNFSKFLITSNL